VILLRALVQKVWMVGEAEQACASAGADKPLLLCSDKYLTHRFPSSD
jgi:hypothetical protein